MDKKSRRLLQGRAMYLLEKQQQITALRKLLHQEKLLLQSAYIMQTRHTFFFCIIYLASVLLR